MTVELITGHAGSAHISSADDGYCNGGLVGWGRYVLNISTKFAAEVQSANVVTIGTGAALFNGRYVRVTATENVAIDNGAQGVNRNDIIAFKYELDSGTSVETVSLVVIKGTATSSSTPTDPTVPTDNILNGATTAYMALWRIPIRGLTVNEPENLYGDVLLSLSGVNSELWAVSQIPNLPASKVTSGTFATARIPSLDASKITSGTFALARIPVLDASRVPNLDTSKVTTGTFAAARIPSLDASKITSGTFSADRIPSLGASKIASGTLSADRIPGLSAAKITSGTLPISRGGTGATTAAAALKNIMAGKTELYNNATGTTGTVTLSATAANYNHMRIYFKATNDNTQCGSVDVYSPNGKYVSLCLVTPVSSPQAGVWVKGAVVYVNGTSITRTVSGNGFAGVADDGNTNNNIYIYRVEAWNE